MLMLYSLYHMITGTRPSIHKAGNSLGRQETRARAKARFKQKKRRHSDYDTQFTMYQLF